MRARHSPLALELAAYAPAELVDLSDSVAILLAEADNGTAAYRAARVSIKATLSRAIAERLAAARASGSMAQVVPIGGKDPRNG